jgi:hypothetical protein
LGTININLFVSLSYLVPTTNNLPITPLQDFEKRVGTCLQQAGCVQPALVAWLIAWPAPSNAPQQAIGIAPLTASMVSADGPCCLACYLAHTKPWPPASDRQCITHSKQGECASPCCMAWCLAHTKPWLPASNRTASLAGSKAGAASPCWMACFLAPTKLWPPASWL